MCDKGFFYDTENDECVECKSKVTGCETCDPYTGKCLTCSEQQRVPNPAGDKCICEKRTWEDD